MHQLQYLNISSGRINVHNLKFFSLTQFTLLITFLFFSFSSKDLYSSSTEYNLDHYQSNREDFSSVERELLFLKGEKQEFQSRLNRLRAKISQNQQTFLSDNLRFKENTLDLENPSLETQPENVSPIEETISPVSQEAQPTLTSNKDQSRSFEGVYFIPFLGLSIPGELSWKTPLGQEYEIDQNSGFSFGADVGYQWKYIYSSFGALFNRSNLNAIQTGGPKITYEGTENLLNMDFNLGARFQINHFTTFNLGIGLGGCFQQFSSTFAKVLEHQDYDFLGTYNFHTSLGFQPGDHWYLGLGYKLLRSNEMEFYTARNLHIFQFFGTYLF